MQSSELAALAGVTVRALRHYHQIGILEEPERGRNGYRTYSVHDLIRVLRIRRLAALGVPLDEMASLLDDRHHATAAVLDRLDAELAAQVDRLTAQRELIAQLRKGPVVPDLPPELAKFFGHLETSLTPETDRLDRDQTVLLAHVVGASGMPHLVDYYERINDPGLAPVLAGLTEQFNALGPDTSVDGVRRYVDDIVSALTPVVRALGVDAPDFALPSAAELVTEYTDSVLNQTQREALAMVGARFDALE